MRDTSAPTCSIDSAPRASADWHTSDQGLADLHHLRAHAFDGVQRALLDRPDDLLLAGDLAGERLQASLDAENGQGGFVHQRRIAGFGLQALHPDAQVGDRLLCVALAAIELLSHGAQRRLQRTQGLGRSRTAALDFDPRQPFGELRLFGAHLFDGAFEMRRRGGLLALACLQSLERLAGGLVDPAHRQGRARLGGVDALGHVLQRLGEASEIVGGMVGRLETLRAGTRHGAAVIGKHRLVKIIGRRKRRGPVREADAGLPRQSLSHVPRLGIDPSGGAPRGHSICTPPNPNHPTLIVQF